MVNIKQIKKSIKDKLIGNYEKSSEDWYVPAAKVQEHIHLGKNFILYKPKQGHHTYLVRGDTGRCTIMGWYRLTR